MSSYGTPIVGPDDGTPNSVPTILPLIEKPDTKQEWTPDYWVQRELFLERGIPAKRQVGLGPYDRTASYDKDGNVILPPTRVRHARRRKGRPSAPRAEKPNVREVKPDHSRLADLYVMRQDVFSRMDRIKKHANRHAHRRARVSYGFKPGMRRQWGRMIECESWSVVTPAQKVLAYLDALEVQAQKLEELRLQATELTEKIREYERIRAPRMRTVNSTLYPTFDPDNPVRRGPSRQVAPHEHRELVALKAHHAMAASGDRWG